MIKQQIKESKNFLLRLVVILTPGSVNNNRYKVTINLLSLVCTLNQVIEFLSY